MSDATPPAATATAGTATAAPSRRAHIALRALQVVLALFFGVASAFPKLIGHSSAAESFDKIGFGDWYMYLVGGLVRSALPFRAEVMRILGLEARSAVVRCASGNRTVIPVVAAVRCTGG
ncbi:DoxX family protein [Streptomyces sp. A3M-1-3]|uniref:DoxX family protein n=1 Tax=Streptomyces sp. A3M-1-3 TaxID=2962044 RepID=UPI0020B806C4|nr:DoxX family protein [Streptomyces sp. A3M-1-3]MCP3820985.1 DoxX family protein [Streptomyces sp. A3M-1-3]